MVRALVSLALLFLPIRLEAQELRYQGRTFSQWQAHLRDIDPTVRRTAVEALGRFGPRAVPVLATVLKDRDQEVRRAAASALGETGPSAIPTLVQALKDSNVDVRFYAAEALGTIGPTAADDAVPTLIKLLTTDEDRAVRHRAAKALASFGPGAKDAVPALIRVLENPQDTRYQEDFVYEAAVEAIARIGPAAKDAVPVLIQRLDRNPWRRLGDRAAPEDEALAKIGPPAVLAVIEVLEKTRVVPRGNTPDSSRLNGVLTVIRLMGPAAKDAVPGLIRLLELDTSRRLGLFVTEDSRAIEALGAIGPAAKDAIPVLTRLAKSPLHPAAARALANIKKP